MLKTMLGTKSLVHIWSNSVYHESLTIAVLLTLKTSLWEKSMEPLKPRLGHMVLRTVANFAICIVPSFGRKTDIDQ